ncbi:MAG: glycosyltransferase family 4 protein [Pseudomonadota bacterium]
MTRLAILTSHPIQYYAPLFRELAERVDLHVFFAHKATSDQQGQAGFGTSFDWDIDLTSGYEHSFLKNISKSPDATRFSGCDTPEIGQRLKDGRFDAVLSLGWHLKSLLQGVWAAKRQRRKVLIRGDSQLSTPRNPLKRLTKSISYPALLRVFDVALYVGTRNREYFRHYHFPKKRLVRSPHCVETSRFAVGATENARRSLRQELGVSPETPLLAFAGKQVEFKRPFDLIDAIAELRNRGVAAEAMFIGSGPLEDSLRQRAKGRNIVCHFLGFQNQSEMPRAYAAADILVLPSTGRETWGLVCNEALACNTPLLVSDAVGCATDLVGDQKVGRAFKLGDPIDCAKKALELISNPPAADDMKAYTNAYSLSAAADGILAGIELA